MVSPTTPQTPESLGPLFQLMKYFFGRQLNNSGRNASATHSRDSSLSPALSAQKSTGDLKQNAKASSHESQIHEPLGGTPGHRRKKKEPISDQFGPKRSLPASCEISRETCKGHKGSQAEHLKTHASSALHSATSGTCVCLLVQPNVEV